MVDASEGLSATVLALFHDGQLMLCDQDAQDQVILNTYTISHTDGLLGVLHRARIDVNRPVVFRDLSVHDQLIHAPDADIIALHAACANIAHMWGVEEHLRELYRDTDSISVMTHPNAAYELSRALKTLQLVSATA